MFSWFKKKGSRTEPSRRAFRPAADPLESREVLSAFASNATFNAFTAGMQFGNFYGNSNALASVGRNLGATLAGVSESPTAASTAVSSATTTARTVATTSTGTVSSALSKTIPRLGGFSTTIPRLGGFTDNALTDPALTASNASRSGLSFSNIPAGNPTGTNTTTLTNGVGVTGSNIGLSTLISAGNSPLTGLGANALNSVSTAFDLANTSTGQGVSRLNNMVTSTTTIGSPANAGSITFGGSGVMLTL